MSNNKIALLISFFSLIIAFTVNEINLRELRKDGIELRENETVITSDDEGYLFPFRIFAETGSTYRNEFEKYLSIVRMPGYGIIYGVIGKFFGLKHALLILKIFQLLLFSISIYCLFFISLKVFQKTTLAVITTGIYGLLPFSMGFLYYTLTEAITPALLIFYIFFLLKAHETNDKKKKKLLYLISAL